jgi:DNA-binding transcriptional LysR family regulator
MDDPSVAISACLTGQGIFQSLAIGLAPLLSRGELIQILPEWSEELYPLYAYHPSRHLPPAKVRALLDFIQEIAVCAQLILGLRGIRTISRCFWRSSQHLPSR